jgi:DUF1680 family protein
MGENMECHAGIVDNASSPRARVLAVPISAVEIRPGFWTNRMDPARRKGLPRLLGHLEDHGVVDNFRRISQGKEVPRKGPVFTDSDLYKWMEAAAFSLQWRADDNLDQLLESVIDDVAGAQGEDGYLNTYFSGDKANLRFGNLERDHELYCAGHLIQAAIAHYRATGRTNLLDVAVRFADYLASVFGEGRRGGFCGHPELEMAMVELYRTTGKETYLDFAGYLLDQIKFHERRTMEGHAVRAAYACCGGADYFAETGNGGTWEALVSLWTDMSARKSYVTGGIGSRYVGEAFGEPYELPNLRAYAETCAAIANAMWAWRMFLITGEPSYCDMLENILYNGFLAGVSLSGDRYFYVNPLESSGEATGERGHRRREWYDCTCCPTNVQRTISSIPGYIYGLGKGEVWICLYQASRLEAEISGTRVIIEQETEYPWKGRVDLLVSPEKPTSFQLCLRVPAWARDSTWSTDGSDPREARPGSILRLDREWRQEDKVSLELGMPIRLIRAHPRAREDFGCAAIARGPLVYCLESVDNPDVEVRDLVISREARPAAEFREDTLGGVSTISFDAFVASSPGTLYGEPGGPDLKSVRATAIPYYAWANRGGSSMLVWIPLLEALEGASRR